MTIQEMVDHFNKYYSSGIPCTPAEVAMLEYNYRLKLPEPYRQFLLFMGKGAGVYDTGSDWEYSWLQGMKQSADKMLVAEGFPPLPQDAFVFWMHQGYQFCFFHTSLAGEDPLVYYFNACYAKAGIVNLGQHLSHVLARPGDKYDVIGAAIEHTEPNC